MTPSPAPEDVRALIPQYLADTLSPQERQLLESHLENDNDLRAEVEQLRSLWTGLGLLQPPDPSASLRARFYQNLNAALHEKSAAKAMPWWKLHFIPQMAAAALIFSLGFAASEFRTKLFAPPSEVSQLRTEVENLRQNVALSLLQTPSASSRLQGIGFSDQIKRPDQEFLTALLTTLNDDPDVNVRLAALEALEKFTADDNVRKALERSIPAQQSPLVQIALIDSLVHIGDRAAAGEFKQLVGNTDLNAAVRERARWGLEKLHFE